VGAVPVTVCKHEWPVHEHEPSRLAVGDPGAFVHEPEPSRLVVGGLGTSVHVRVQCEAANLVAWHA
jgi:hypothetical protein